MLTKPFKPLALAFLVNLIISVEDKIKYKVLAPRSTDWAKGEFDTNVQQINIFLPMSARKLLKKRKY